MPTMIRYLDHLVPRPQIGRPGFDADATKYPPSTHGVRAHLISGSESIVGRIKRAGDWRIFPFPNLWRWRLVVSHRTVTCMVLKAKANDELSGPRSDYIRQVALETKV
ncbi:hypothetical protein TNCV_1265511 [Trichonephila clavipes]|nr:hypothetical protein TNCV_1265511 [Trichonephila clavipes]